MAKKRPELGDFEGPRASSYCPDGGENVFTYRSLVHRARQIATVGLLGAVLGGAFAGLPVSFGAGVAVMGMEEIGLGVGLAAGVMLALRHYL